MPNGAFDREIREFRRFQRGPWRLDYVGGVSRDHRVLSEPKVDVFFSPLKPGPLKPKDILSAAAVDASQQQRVQVGISLLPCLKIGSVWEAGKRIEGPNGEFGRTTIDTTETSNSLQLCDGSTHFGSEAREFLIPKRFLTLSRALGTYVFMVPTSSREECLVIPVMELLRSYYSSSSQWNRALFTGLASLVDNSIIDPERSWVNGRTVQVSLQRDFPNEDAFIVARLLTESAARRAVWALSQSLSIGAMTSQTGFYAPKVFFPFEGETTLRYRYKKFESRVNPFVPQQDAPFWHRLVTHIEECTHPFNFDVLLHERKNSASYDAEPDDSREECYKNSHRSLSSSTGNEPIDSEEEPTLSTSRIIESELGLRFKDRERIEVVCVDENANEYRSASTPPNAMTAADLLSTGGGEGVDGNVPYGVQPESQLVREHVPDSLKLTLAALGHIKRLEDSFRYDLTSIKGLTPQFIGERLVSQMPAASPKRARRSSQWYRLKDGSIRAVLIVGVTIEGFAPCHLIEIESDLESKQSFSLLFLKGGSGTSSSSEDAIKVFLQRLSDQGGKGIVGLTANPRWARLRHTVTCPYEWAERILARYKHLAQRHLGSEPSAIVRASDSLLRD